MRVITRALASWHDYNSPSRVDRCPTHERRRVCLFGQVRSLAYDQPLPAIFYDALFSETRAYIQCMRISTMFYVRLQDFVHTRVNIQHTQSASQCQCTRLKSTPILT